MDRGPGGITDCQVQAGTGTTTVSTDGFNMIGNGDTCPFVPGTGDQVGTAATPIDPRLGPLQANGGPTGTMALLAGSPAINMGSPAALGSGGAACPGRGLSAAPSARTATSAPTSGESARAC